MMRVSTSIYLQSRNKIWTQTEWLKVITHHAPGLTDRGNVSWECKGGLLILVGRLMYTSNTFCLGISAGPTLLQNKSCSLCAILKRFTYVLNNKERRPKGQGPIPYSENHSSLRLYIMGFTVCKCSSFHFLALW